MDLKGQIALVTGASSGIGRATAEALARRAARVAVHYHSNREGALEAVDAVRHSGAEAMTVCADVTSTPEITGMVADVRRQWGPIDVLVNNAGDLVARQTLADMTEEYWDRVLALNLKSAFLCVKVV